MGTPTLSDEICREAVALVEEALRSGGRPLNQSGPGKSAVQMAAEWAFERGICKSKHSLQGRVRIAIERGIVPDWSLYRPTRYQQPQPEAVLRHAPPQDTAAHDLSDAGEMVLIIPDLHNDPRHPSRVDCLTWIARFGAERKLPRVEQLGDWMTADSCSSHDRNDTVRGRLKPSVRADLDNLKESLRAFNVGQGDWRPKLRVHYGNHEWRLERFENVTPEAHGSFTGERDQLFAQFGWRTVPYGEVRYVEGVAFTHHLTNGAGRAFGGKLGATRAASEVTCSAVMGHTHNWKLWPAAKIGPLSGVEIMEAGCALPWGEIEAYATVSTNDWWWGVTVAHLQGGRIHDVERVSMLNLRKRYSDDGADIRRG